MLQFPKNKSWRVRMRLASKEKKAALSISLVSIIVATLVVNQWITRLQSQTNLAQQAEMSSLSLNGNRVLASVNDQNYKPTSIAISEQIKKEHELAHRISNDDISAGIMAQAITNQDHLIYEVLQGKYGVSKTEGKISRFEFLNSDNSLPVIISDKVAFLEKNHSNFSVDFSKVNLDKNTAGNKEVYRLFSKDNALIGLAEFQLDQEGRVLSVEIQNK